jgi:hypothetical protein
MSDTIGDDHAPANGAQDFHGLTRGAREDQERGVTARSRSDTVERCRPATPG